MADEPREVELKLVLEPGAAARLRAHPLLAGVEAQTVEQKSVYFDTRGQALRKAGFSLRIRTAGGRRVQTVKATGASAGLFDRPEWEQAVDGDTPALDAIGRTLLAPLLTAGRARRLVPLVVSQVRRTRWDVDRFAAAIEIALDEGAVEAAGRRHGLCELELELKSGPPQALFAAGRALAADLPLRIGVLSKAEQGFALAGGRLGKVAKAEPVALDASMRVADAFAAVVAACLRHFRRNEGLVRDARDPAALHQARVAMRRLRAAFSLFAPAMRCEALAPLRAELRWFTAGLGEARNLDVLLAGAEWTPVDRRKVEAAREEAYDGIAETLDSPRLRLLMIDLLAWAETGPWRARRRARGPFDDFAGRRLDRLWEKVAARGAVLRELGEEERHRLRIDVKKLRYAVEFAATVYAEPSARKRFRNALEAMQECLGHLNDIATARLLHARYGLAAAPPAADAGAAGAGHLAEAERAFRQLRRAPPFWRRARDEPA
ncbi:MAG: CHAD domain-containing protein [Alphaproteobacteria bacterium]|nr:CHAD domain-containing protein [Alphaproteobacteria bacterium]